MNHLSKWGHDGCQYKLIPPVEASRNYCGKRCSEKICKIQGKEPVMGYFLVELPNHNKDAVTWHKCVMLCAIWYHFYNLKNVKNAHGEVLLLVKLQASAWNSTKSNTPPAFFTFVKLYKWCQIAEHFGNVKLRSPHYKA